ncbi:hypothetical protein B9Z55_027488 [Caenorhabditis nigoni]|uniref:Domain of unknown function WSN domain-containing protein n=1 Tax=Caenorhabditis nigoni TaxID=1611254 RepID=A0A2G5SG73_9PELO|nr:hypothetical protein B9Z55_027488 [Caenorhabditis nigoni]
MWFLLVTNILLISISSIETTKQESFGIKDVHKEIVNLAQRAINYRLEKNVYTESYPPADVLQWILDKKINEIAWMAYGKMKIQNGIAGQTELLSLVEEMEGSLTTEDERSEVEKGFEVMDGMRELNSSIREMKINDLKWDAEYVDRFPTEFKSDYPQELQKSFENAEEHYKIVLDEMNELLSTYPANKTISEDDSYSILEFLSDKIEHPMREAENSMNYIKETFKNNHYTMNPEDLDGLKKLRNVSEIISLKTEGFKSLKALIPFLEHIESDMDVLGRLRDGEAFSGIREFLNNMKVHLEELKGYRIVPRIYKVFQKIPSMTPLLPKIVAFADYMTKYEPRMTELSKRWKPLEDHLNSFTIPLGTEKFKELKNCLQKFNFSQEISADGLIEEDDSFGEIPELNRRLYQEIEKLELDDLYYSGTIKQTYRQDILKDGMGQFERMRDNVKQRLRVLGESRGIYEDLVNKMAGLMTDVVSGKATEFMEDDENVKQLESIKSLMTCYSFPNFDSIKELLKLSVDAWKFDVQVLENTVDVVGMIKGALVKLNDVRDWKRDGYDPNDWSRYNGIPLDNQEVRVITDGLHAFESILKAQEGWERLKDFDLSAVISDIDQVWKSANETMTRVLESVSRFQSNKKVDDLPKFLKNIAPPDGIDTEQIKKAIEEKYEENGKRDLLNIVNDLKNFQNSFPTHKDATMFIKMINKMKKWEDSKHPVPTKNQTMIDCSETNCDIILKLPSNV